MKQFSILVFVFVPCPFHSRSLFPILEQEVGMQRNKVIPEFNDILFITRSMDDVISTSPELHESHFPNLFSFLTLSVVTFNYSSGFAETHFKFCTGHSHFSRMVILVEGIAEAWKILNVPNKYKIKYF